MLIHIYVGYTLSEVCAANCVSFLDLLRFRFDFMHDGVTDFVLVLLKWRRRFFLNKQERKKLVEIRLAQYMEAGVCTAGNSELMDP
jgi:hypothetical protein